MFQEFSRCSLKGFTLSVLTGGAAIALFACLAVVTGKAAFLQAGLVIGLASARWGEALSSRNCSRAQVALEGAVLALVGAVLVTVDNMVMSLWV